MKRRTLDTIFAGGGIVVAILLVVLAYAVFAQATFATDYVKQELSAQKITFAPVANLTDSEKSWKAGSTCLVTYAGQAMQTGAQAECYAKYYIREHMTAAAEGAGFPGATYATLGTTRSEFSAQIAAAKTKGDTATVDSTQKKLDAATGLRTTMQTGETLSGLLLTTFGFSVIGSIAQMAANVLYLLAGVMVLLSVAGLVHAYVTPKEKVVFGPAVVRPRIPVQA